MDRELTQNALKVSLTEWDEVVEALTSDGADQSFAECVCHRCPNWRFDWANDELAKGLVQGRRAGRIAVVDHKAVWVIECQELAELLGGPRGDWMPVTLVGRIRRDLHCQEYVEDVD